MRSKMTIFLYAFHNDNIYNALEKVCDKQLLEKYRWNEDSVRVGFYN